MVEEKNNTDEEEDLLVLFVHASANEVSLIRWKQNVQVSKKLINFKINAGFDVNLISKHLQGIFEIKKNMENGTI